MDIKELIKNNRVYFDHYRQGNFYYNLIVPTPQDQIVNEAIPMWAHYDQYQFTVPLEDIGTATLMDQDKAILFMRWIKKALEEKTLIKL